MRAVRATTIRRVALLAGLFLGAVGASAQGTRIHSLTVRVTVTDSADRPVAGADVSVIRGLQQSLGRATTNDGGVASVVLPRIDGDVQLTVRRIGYQRADRFFTLADTATFRALRIVMQRSVQQLAPVQVNAEADLKRKSYHADADDIANSKRPIFDGFDILTKLRPDMLFGRAGPSGGCIIHDVWVNGRRVVFPVITEMDRARHARQPKNPMSRVPLSVEAAMRSIKPEHIAEVNYADCFDTSVVRPGAQNAVFVSLKPGIGYDPGRGSYVLDEPATSTRAVAAYHNRLVGVYDALSGDPIVDAAVKDSSSGMFVTTTSTGTVSLAFLPDGPAVLHVIKPGYQLLRFDVSISPRDTTPITLLLERPK